MNEYPCKDCIIKGICTKLCDKLESDLTLMITERCCIDCGGNEFSEYILGIQYMVCRECNSTYYFSKYTTPGAERTQVILMRSIKSIYPLVGYNKATFGECIDNFMEGLEVL